MKQIKIDKTDEKIINELLYNAKIPLRTLAKKLNINFVTVMNRIKKLENQGVIQKYVAQINYDLLGYEIHVLIDISLKTGKLKEFEKTIAKFPQIYTIYDVTGNFDALIIGRFKSTRTLETFVKKLQDLDFIDSTNTKLVLSTVKETSIRI